MKRILLISILTALAAAGSASAAPFKGVVVAKQRGVLLVAAPGGVVRAVAGKTAVGTRVSIRGTRVVSLGKARHAIVRGIFVRRAGNLTFLKAARHTFAVRAARTLASVRVATQPQPGDLVLADVSIAAGGTLVADSLTLAVTPPAVPATEDVEVDEQVEDQSGDQVEDQSGDQLEADDESGDDVDDESGDQTEVDDDSGDDVEADDQSGDQNED